MADIDDRRLKVYCRTENHIVIFDFDNGKIIQKIGFCARLLLIFARLDKKQEKMLLFPNCKINIGLDILRRRPDGFHDIETVMYPVMGLCDGLEMIHSDRAGVQFSGSGLAIGCPPGGNLAVRAYGLMRSRYGISGIKMHLHKSIPFGAGLGGGSADAAFTIAGLDKLFNL